MKKTKDKGITLIALIITIIVLIILASISITFLSGDNGILNKAQSAKNEYTEAASKEELIVKISELNLKIVSEQNRKMSLIDLKTLENQDGIESVDIIGTEDNPIGIDIIYNGYKFEINSYFQLVNAGDVKIVADVNSTIEEKSILEALSNTTFKTSGNYTLKINGIAPDGSHETINYSTNLINYNGDLTLDGTTSVSGATLVSNTYEFGDNTKDVGTSSTNAKNTVILKVNGNLTINSGVILTACKDANGYGGPKGLIVYCTGTLINNGIISMTARGGKAIGENVYLCRNTLGLYEYVPSIGGASSYLIGNNITSKGIAGENGTGRATGGGGTGSLYLRSSYTNKVCGGSSGTSYSGGTGGASLYRWSNSSRSYGDSFLFTNSDSNGGNGGKPYAYQDDYNNGYCNGACGGAGNSVYANTFVATNGSIYANIPAEKGTGGLLVIYSTRFVNNGNIQSNGSKGGTAYGNGGCSASGSGGSRWRINKYFC